MFAVDAGSTQSVGKTVAKYGLKSKGVVAGGFDLNPATLSAIKAGDLDFTIDQQPYLQGFLPVLYLYLYKLSGGLLGALGDQHRPAVRHQGQRRPLPGDQDAVRGVEHDAAAGEPFRPHRAQVMSAPAEATETEAPATRRPRAIGRAADAFLRRREATILVVAIALLVYFQSARSAFLTTTTW